MKRQSLNPLLWQACDDIYHQHQACLLQLQNQYNLNVNLILLAVWLNQNNYYLTQAQWRQLNSELHLAEKDLLLTFRQWRKASKPQVSDTEYQHILQLELMLERKSQALILTKITPIVSRTTGCNLCAYFANFNFPVAAYFDLKPYMTNI